MTRMLQRVVLASAMVAFGGPAFAQLPPGSERPLTPAEQRAARRGLPPGASQQPADALTNEQVFRILDSYVMANAQQVLQLNDAQWSAFFQRMMRLQEMQRQHRNQRQRLLNQLRQTIGPRAQQAGVDDATVAARTKEFDDLELQAENQERAALADIDQVLQVRQRAHFRVFLETMERQKLELLIKARQSGRTTNPPPSVPAPVGKGQ
jgi:hypothetical protein